MAFFLNNRLVAQLSQNMNFIMDLSVKEFLEMHAQSRMIENSVEVIERIMQSANDLAGERFSPRYARNRFKRRSIQSIDDCRYCYF